MITAKDIHDGRIWYSGARHTSQEAYENRLTSKSRPIVGDVLLTKDGSIGRLAVCDRPDVCINQSVALLRVNQRLDAYYLKYLLEAPNYQTRMDADADGSTIKHIYITRIDKMEVAVPSLPEQQAVIAMLGTLDRRTELLRQTNETLVAMARAIFKSWFVDFDPVRAKAEGREPEGMDAATAALFPSEFQDSELGPIPKGWSPAVLGDSIQVIKGKSYRSDDLVREGPTALVTLKSFERGGGFRLDGFKPYKGTYKEEQLVHDGEIIVSFTDVTQAADVIGKAAVVTRVDPFAKLVASLDVGIVRPRRASEFPVSFLHGLVQSPDFHAHTFAHTSGTTVLHLAKNAIGDYRYSLPPVQLRNIYDAISQPLFDKHRNSIRVVQTLSALRDTLLPRLISGKLRVPEAEALLAEAF